MFVVVVVFVFSGTCTYYPYFEINSTLACDLVGYLTSNIKKKPLNRTKKISFPVVVSFLLRDQSRLLLWATQPMAVAMFRDNALP